MVLASGAGLFRADLPQPCDDDEVTAMGMLLGHGLNILYLDPDAGGTVLLTQSRRPRPSPPLRVSPAVRPPVIDHPGISSPSCASLSRSSAAGACAWDLAVDCAWCLGYTVWADGYGQFHAARGSMIGWAKIKIWNHHCSLGATGLGASDDLGDADPEGAPSRSSCTRVDAVEKVGGAPSRSCWGTWTPARRLEVRPARAARDVWTPGVGWRCAEPELLAARGCRREGWRCAELELLVARGRRREGWRSWARGRRREDWRSWARVDDGELLRHGVAAWVRRLASWPSPLDGNT